MGDYWGDLDFKMNRTLWNDLGNEIAIPVRMRNLRDYFDAVSSVNLTSWLYGRSLRSAWVKGRLFQDHDDDVKLAGYQKDGFSSGDFFALLQARGFEVIRKTHEMTSIVRFERYIDIHLAEKAERTIPLRVHGEELPISEKTEDHLMRKYGKEYRALVGALPSKGSGSARSAVRFNFFIPGTRFSRVLAPPRYQEKRLTEHEFLDLKIDADDAVNWSWRKHHLDPIFARGEKLREAVERVQSLGIDALIASVREVDTSRTFVEPMNMSRRFWHEGSNFFVYPVVFGFRHQVMPYMGANTYISLGMVPLLYTREYFMSLPQMSDPEIEDFSSYNPIEVDGDCVVSGRHRVAAMVGRLARGLSYIPIQARIKI